VKTEVYKHILSSGRYPSTGKVLIGVQHQPRLRKLSYDEERIQSILLGFPQPRLRLGLAVYVLYAIAVGTLASAVITALQ
jgi:hypothetical protein